MDGHPLETTLELFVLGSASLSEADRDDTARHTEQCAGCRTLVETMRKFYDTLRNDLGAAGDDPPDRIPETLTAIDRSSLPDGTRVPGE
jgi:anti-sigma factor RsiW